MSSVVYVAGVPMHAKGKPVAKGQPVDVSAWDPAVVALYVQRGRLVESQAKHEPAPKAEEPKAEEA